MILIRHPGSKVSISTRLSVQTILSRTKPYTTSARLIIDRKQRDFIPKAKIKWYYATDVPLSKPSWFEYSKSSDASKFIPFSDYDSNRIEKHFHKYFERTQESEDLSPIVEVSEDRLFQVNVRDFTLAPVYWEGPVYEVRRGLWFQSDGTPFSDTLTQEIEMGYDLKKPYLFDEERKVEATKKEKHVSGSELSKFNSDEGIGDEALNMEAMEDDVVKVSGGKAVMYFDDSRAVIFPDSMITDFHLPIIRKLGASTTPLLSVHQIQRGFTDDLITSMMENFTSKSALSKLNEMLPDPSTFFSNDGPVKKLVNYSDENDGNEAKQNKEMEEVIEDDFENSTNKKSSERDIEHVVFCVHGIGQVLGTKYESINFAHNINMLRNTMKAVYKENNKFKNLAHPDGGFDSETNNKIQVLPIAWRHMVGFHPNKVPEEDQNAEEPRLPTLSQINVDGVKSLRNIIGEVALDILLYYESKYFNQILDSVTEEINRVYKLYMERNPNFKGKFHLLGHSLGSAISFDILSRQYNERPKNPDPKVDLLFDLNTLFCVGCPVGVFKLISQKNIIHRKDLAEDFDPRDPSLTFSSPKCEDLYNLYHPCDPIGYRMEPLIKPRFSKFKAEEAPFAIEGINTQIKGLTTFTEDIQDRFAKATEWLLKKKKRALIAEGVQDDFIDENPLGEIVSSIVKSTNDGAEEYKEQAKLSEKDLNELVKFNRRARVDYSLPMGVFDISLVSAISAHVSYFEDQDTAGFLMRELLLGEKAPVTSKVVLYRED